MCRVRLIVLRSRERPPTASHVNHVAAASAQGAVDCVASLEDVRQPQAMSITLRRQRRHNVENKPRTS